MIKVCFFYFDVFEVFYFRDEIIFNVIVYNCWKEGYDFFYVFLFYIKIFEKFYFWCYVFFNVVVENFWKFN